MSATGRINPIVKKQVYCQISDGGPEICPERARSHDSEKAWLKFVFCQIEAAEFWRMS